MSKIDRVIMSIIFLFSGVAGLYGSWKLIIPVAILLACMIIGNMLKESQFAPGEGGATKARLEFCALILLLVLGFVGNELGWTAFFNQTQYHFLRP